VSPPLELVELEDALGKGAPDEASDQRKRAAVDPHRFRLHRLQLRGPRKRAPEIDANREALVDRALAEGPSGLTPAEWKLVLSSGEAIEHLHERAWRLDPRRAAVWGVEDPDA
jgi:membrane glycosyltransferase